MCVYTFLFWIYFLTAYKIFENKQTSTKWHTIVRAYDWLGGIKLKTVKWLITLKHDFKWGRLQEL